MSLPVLVIAGRPNVGKSTLFNHLTNSRDAIVAAMPGVTRDRQYGRGKYEQQAFIVVDTGGIGLVESLAASGEAQQQALQNMTETQAQMAIAEADHVLIVVDAKAGLSPEDIDIVEQMRRQAVPYHLIVNKADRLAASEAASEFYHLGISSMHVIAAQSGRGVNDMLQALLQPSSSCDATTHSDSRVDPSNQAHASSNSFTQAPAGDNTHTGTLPKITPKIKNQNGAEETTETEAEAGNQSKIKTVTEQNSQPIRIAMLGRPNVGKSTLINCMLGEQRVMVYDAPGTTRDSISIPFQRHGQDYILVDTAGIRRRARIQQAVEKFSILKSLKAISQSDIAICVIDASVGLHEQDLRLLQQAVSHAHAMIIAFNKWDCLDEKQRLTFKEEVDRRLAFTQFARRYHISALHGSGLGDLYRAIAEIQAAMDQDFNTGTLNKWLERAVEKHQPPLSKGRRIRLRYAHICERRPLSIMIHGKQLDHLAGSYKRYLVSYFQKKLKLTGIPLRLEFSNDHNPYVDEQ